MKGLLIAGLSGLLVLLAGSGWAGHKATGGIDKKCIPCHQKNLIYNHIQAFKTNFDGDTLCWRCHSNTRQAVKDTIAAGKAGQEITCTNCHTTVAPGSNPMRERHPAYFTQWNEMDGVVPGPSTGRWVPVKEYTPIAKAQKQYQRCFKCHSYNSLGEQPGGVSPIITDSGVNLTDLSMEFNVNNRSAHPVVNTLNEQTGSYEPRSLRASQMRPEWSSVGNQTLQCTNCHGAVDSSPQGANNKYFLIGERTYWPESSSGRLFTLSDVGSGGGSWGGGGSWSGSGGSSNAEAELFCLNCHVVRDSNRAHAERKHSSWKCVYCHQVIPHGGRNSRLIAYKEWGPPFAHQEAKLSGFRKASGPFDYSAGNAYATTSPCWRHFRGSGSYDSNSSDGSGGSGSRWGW